MERTTRTTLNVHIGLKHYTYIVETGEVFLNIDEKWDHSGLSTLVRKAHGRAIKKFSPKWVEVRRLAMPFGKNN